MESGLGKSDFLESFPPRPVEGGTVRVGELLFPRRKVWMKTFGCQMNLHDTERILCLLKPLNFTPTGNLDEAHLVLLNSCAVRELADNKFYSLIGEMKHAKKKREGLVVGIGGCVSQTRGRELIGKYPQLDFAFGTDAIDQVAELVYRAYAGERKFAINAWDRSENFSIETKMAHNSPRAFVNIIKGCNKYCTYCIVPYTRGRERSRRVEEVVRDIRRLVEHRGVQEVMLLGQNVNSFGKDNGESLAQLLYRLEEVEGLRLIRYTTSHPYDVSDELIGAHGELEKLSGHLHLPVQSGSDAVLQRMGREYSVAHYLGLLDKLRAACPGIVLTTDIIVGFVNETEEEFAATLELLDRAQYDSIYSYAYSPRPKTRASRLKDCLTDEVRGQRLRHLQGYQLDIQRKIRRKLVGREFPILIDGHSRKGGNKKWRGRTDCNRVVHIPSTDGRDYKWKWKRVKITEAHALSLQGTFL